MHPLNLIKGKANEIDLDPALKKVMDLRQWFENQLEPIVDKVEHSVEEVEEVADKVEEVVEKVVEKVEGSDKVGEVVEKVVEKVDGSDKVVDKVDDVVTKVERVVDNFNEIIQMKEAPKVEGKGWGK